MILTETKDYKSVLEDCYSSDKEFIDKYHDTPGAGLENCVGRDTSLFSAIPGYVMYDISEGEKRVGYFGVDGNYEPPFMFGFFIKPEFRTAESLDEFWKNVRLKFQSDFLGACSPNNTQALNHMISRGGEQFLKGRDVVILKFKN